MTLLRSTQKILWTRCSKAKRTKKSVQLWPRLLAGPQLSALTVQGISKITITSQRSVRQAPWRDGYGENVSINNKHVVNTCKWFKLLLEWREALHRMDNLWCIRVS